MRTCLLVAALGLGAGWSGAVSAQPSRGTPLPGGTQPVTMTPLLPDLVAAVDRVPTAIAEQWSATNPCTQHSHTWNAYLRIKGRFSASTPAPTAILYRDDQPIQTWTLTIPSGNQPVTLGSFTWTKDHPCSAPGVTFSQPPTPNYRLVVDPSGKLAEMTENNNVVVFHIDPAVQFVKAP